MHLIIVAFCTKPATIIGPVTPPFSPSSLRSLTQVCPPFFLRRLPDFFKKNFFPGLRLREPEGGVCNGEANVGGGTRSRDERGQFNHQEGKKNVLSKNGERGEIMMMMQKRRRRL